VKTTILTICALIALGASPASAATLYGIGTYQGTAGVGRANGDVTAPPNADASILGDYIYVSTAGSNRDRIGLDVGDETNGSELTTYSFSVEAGDVFSYDFNYITSDGGRYTDYAYAMLSEVSGYRAIDTLIFTARTNPYGDTAPGFGLPKVDDGVTLDPASTAIIDGAPVWDALGDYSGWCFDDGCGYTGWIQASYTFATAGIYTFTFGVVNWEDELYDSGLAVAGITLNGKPILDDPDLSAVPVPASAWLLMAGLGGLAAFGRRRKLR